MLHIAEQKYATTQKTPTRANMV